MTPRKYVSNSTLASASRGGVQTFDTPLSLILSTRRITAVNYNNYKQNRKFPHFQEGHPFPPILLTPTRLYNHAQIMIQDHHEECGGLGIITSP